MNSTVAKLFENKRDKAHRALASRLADVARETSTRGMFNSGAHVELAYKEHEKTIRELARQLVEGYREYHKSTHRPVDSAVVAEAKAALAQMLADETGRSRESVLVLCLKLNSGTRLEEHMKVQLDALSRAIMLECEREVEAWHEVEQAQARPAPAAGERSSVVFVIMPIGRKETDLFYNEVIKPAAVVHGFEARPVNLTEGEEGITERALALIAKGPFVICDLTFARPNCYYEAGFAQGKGVLVLLTAREDHNPRANSRTPDQAKVHFDLDQKNITFWSERDLLAARKELTERIQRTLEQLAGRPPAERPIAGRREVSRPVLDLIVMKRQNFTGTPADSRAVASHSIAVVPVGSISVPIDQDTERRLTSALVQHLEFLPKPLQGAPLAEHDSGHITVGRRNCELNLHWKWAVTSSGAVIFERSVGYGPSDTDTIGDILLDGIVTLRLAAQWLDSLGYSGDVEIFFDLKLSQLRVLRKVPPGFADLYQQDDYDGLLGVHFEEEQPQERPAVASSQERVSLAQLKDASAVLTKTYMAFFQSMRKARINPGAWASMLGTLMRDYDASLRRPA